MTTRKRQRTDTLIECPWCHDYLPEGEFNEHVNYYCLDAAVDFADRTEEPQTLDVSW
jgi:sarcosine oxidase delta subunit